MRADRWEMTAARKLGVALLAGLVSCGAMLKGSFTDAQDRCLQNSGQCEQSCTRWFAGTEPPSNDYTCESLAMAQSSAAVNGQMRNVTPAFLHFHIAAMENLCGDGIESGCSMRDSLKQMLDERAGNTSPRVASIRAKVAQAKELLASLHLPHTGGFDEEFFNIESALKGNDLDSADQQADAVLKEVQSVAAAHQQADSQQRAADLGAAKLAQEKARLESQAPAVQAATTACDANPAACKTKCDGGDGPSCFAWATRMWKKTNPPNLTDAKVAMQKGCNAQTQAACDALLYVDSDIQTAEANARAAAARLDELWSPVETAADEIARHVWLLQWARQNHVATQNHALMAQKITENTRRLFCPAKAAFIAQSTAAEFNKRAAAHCKDNAPVGSSQGNFYAAETSTQVTLTTQCQTVFASQCP